jgi:hypothetical protein
MNIVQEAKAFFAVVLFGSNPLLPQLHTDRKTTIDSPILDIGLTKDSSLWLHAIHSPFYWRILKKTILPSLVFKIPPNKSAKQGNFSLFLIAYFGMEK